VDDSSRDPYVIGSAFRTLRVLLAFGAAPHRFTLAELVAASGGDKSGLYRSLKTLVAVGFLRQESDGRYALTRAVHLLSAAVEKGRDASLVEVAAPLLDDLAIATGESVHLGALAGDQTVVLDKRTSTEKVRLASVVLGQSVPLHAGAVPKAVLAFSGEERIRAVLDRLDDLPAYTRRTPRDPEALRRELREIRARGYSLSDGDFDDAARGAGAPIFDERGRVVAGVSVGGPAFRLSDRRLHELGCMVRDAAEAISRGLGSPGPAPSRDPPELGQEEEVSPSDPIVR
jgi:IclR family acetate operon transcriptional repressor